jgi:hypothetical protein
MLWTPQKGLVKPEHNMGNVGTATVGVAVTTGASASTKGAVTQLVPATAYDAYWITIMASGYGASATSSAGSLDILVGASGQERVLIPDLLMGFCGAFGSQARGPKIWHFPLYIPAGTRLSAQAAGERVSTAVNVAVSLREAVGSPGFPVGAKVVTYGMVAVPDGTTVTQAASGGTGAWAQITSSTTEDHLALVPSFQYTASTALGIRAIALQLGIGAAAAEKLLGDTYWFNTDGIEFMDGPLGSFPHFQTIPATTRLSMRGSNSGTLAGTSNGVIHAVS